MGKGKQQTPTDQTVTQTNIPEEFMPYFERLMGRVESQTNQPYQPYGGRRIAPMSDFADINKSQGMVRDISGQGIAGLDVAQANAAANIARANELGRYDTGAFTQYGGFKESKVDPYSGFTAGKADPYAGFTASKVDPYSGFKESTVTPYSGFKTTGYDEYTFGPAGEFTGAAVAKYMNPYMQNVVDIEKRRADEDYNISRLVRSSRAVQAGDFGGSRGAVQEGLAERDLLERQGGIQARGLSEAYTDAQGMFSSDRAARMGVEEAQAAEAARVQTGTAAENARVQQAQAEELARVQGISVAEASRVQLAKAEELARTQGISVAEASRIQSGQAAELARTQGIGIDEAARVQTEKAKELARTQGIGVAEAARVQTGQAEELGRVQTGTEASRQFGAGQGIAALDASKAAGTQLVGLGEKEREAQIQNAQLLDTIGREQKAETQAGLDVGYADFLRQQGYPEDQIALFSNSLQGLPIQKSGTTTATGYDYTNPAQQAVGAGLAGLSLYKAYQ